MFTLPIKVNYKYLQNNVCIARAQQDRPQCPCPPFLEDMAGGNNMEQFKPMSLDEAIRSGINDRRNAKEYEQKEQDWLNSERMG